MEKENNKQMDFIKKIRNIYFSQLNTINEDV